MGSGSWEGFYRPGGSKTATNTEKDKLCDGSISNIDHIKHEISQDDTKAHECMTP